MTVLVAQTLGPSLNSADGEGLSLTVASECTHLDQGSFLNNHYDQKVENIPVPNHNDR